MYIFVSTGNFPVSTGNFPVSTLVGAFVGTLWCALHRKSLNLHGHFRGHLRVHSRGHFREHFRERVRGSNVAVRVLCALLSPGSQMFPRILRNLWGSVGRFFGTLHIVTGFLKKGSAEPPKVLRNFGSQARLFRPCKLFSQALQSEKRLTHLSF